MLRNTKWKLEKAKVKVVFRLQFHATNIPQSGWEKLYISFIPTESGKIIAKTSKANVRNGTCKWADPIYETTRLLLDARNKRYDDKLYKLVVGMGTSWSSILGEATINLADYADASNPFVIGLPLHGSDHGTILHVTVQLLTAKTGFREFEQQFDRGLQSSSNLNREPEPIIATSSSSELQISDDHGNKVNTKTHFGSGPKELISDMKETGIHEEFSDSLVRCNSSLNASENYYAGKHDSSSIHEYTDLNGPARNQSPPTKKANSSDHQDCSMDKDLAIAHEDNHKLRGSLELAESSIFELKHELSALHNYANEMGMETQKIAQNLADEIYSGQKLEREIMVLRSECSKFKDELEQLKEIKSSSKFLEPTQDSGRSRIFDQGYVHAYPNFLVGPSMTHDQADCDQRTWINGLLLVEDRIRDLQEKIHIGFHESDLGFLHLDLEVLLSIVQDLEKGTRFQEPGFTRGFDSIEGKKLELLSQLDEAKAERGNLVRKMNEMECYYEALVQELEENQKQILGEFQSLRYEHSTCAYTISTCNAKTESMRHDMNDQISRFTEEIHDLGCVNNELKRRVMIAESRVHDFEENREQILGEFESLRNEHSTCADTISTCKTENESIRNHLNDQISRFAEERHALGSVNNELEKRVMTAESRVQDLEENRERILGEFETLKNEHSKCADAISICKSETESISNDLNNQISRLTEEIHDLGCVNNEIEKRVMTAESRVHDLEENRERILGEFETLKNEHSTCADTNLTCKTETESICNDLRNQISRFSEERRALDCVKNELKERVKTAESRVQDLEENQEQILGEFQSLKNEHSTCADTISTCKTETESIRNDLSNQNLRFTEERRALGCVNNELEKRVKTAESLVQDLEENREQVLGEFESLKNKHSTCADTISTCKTETESIRKDLNNQISRLTKDKHALNCVNQELQKRVTAAESALERARLNYSIAVTQLQKDLDMLSLQVLSMFETNQNLIKETFSESSGCPNIVENLQKSDEFCEICCANLYLDVYSRTLEETLHEISIVANKYAQKLDLSNQSNENMQKFLDFLQENKEETIRCHELEIDIIRVVLKAKLDEKCDECSELKNKLSEFKKLVKELKDKEAEGPSESLRIAFMKEQCETTVHELKQQLFVSKRQCDDILFKLQDALDEIESRKKSEASYLKKIEELSFKIVGLEGELQSMQAELECALLNLECCKEEHEKIYVLEGMKNKKSVLMTSSSSSFQDLQKELVQLHKANEELRGLYPNFKDTPGDGNALERVIALEIELAQALVAKKKSSVQFQSSFLEQHHDEEAVLKSFRDINELIKDTLEIKSKYANVETELNEMQERYSQLSLQFAEVEGERQKLMMTVKNVRSPRNRSESGTVDNKLL